MTRLRTVEQTAPATLAAFRDGSESLRTERCATPAESPALSRFRVLIAPGLHGSGPEHWQSRWEDLHPRFERIEQWSWDRPDLDAWSAAVGHALRRSARPAIVVAHSFGCLAAIHRAAAGAPNLAAALLVAPASPSKFGIERELSVAPLGIPSIVVGSEDDPWLSLDGARHWARRWGSEFVNAGALGHINADSGLADWPAGLALLGRLASLAPADRTRCCGVSCGVVAGAPLETVTAPADAVRPPD